jgi:hypothetical protein
LAASVPRVLREFPPVPEETIGGGGTTLLPKAPDDPLLRAVPKVFPEEMAGGGGTTSWVPKSLPMMLLTSEGLLVGADGGGITVFDGSAMLPLSRRCKFRDESGDGGGAMTEGEGIESLAVWEVSRSGAETGGGTTATLFI